MKKNTLIITEKPEAARRIAQALDANNKPQQRMLGHATYYVATRGHQIVVVPTIGHLYTIDSATIGREHYPVFSFKWQPRYLVEQRARWTRSWIDTVARLAKDADFFIDGCDYDIEGSLIGYNMLKYACNNKEATAKRMKYSTLAKEELEAAYDHLLPCLDFTLIEAGRTRHEIDWLYGVNLTRALTTAAKRNSGRYRTLSTGRVQGPTLEFLAQRERSIRTFVPTPFWTISAEIEIQGRIYEAEYEKRKIDTKKEANLILGETKGKKGRVEKTKTKQQEQLGPFPFDLGTLQGEAYRIFGYTPKRTLETAKQLYLDALISYPRTSSQELPQAIGYSGILENLRKLPQYTPLVTDLLAKPRLVPNQGNRKDPAHPAIYPTGKHPERKLDHSENSIWDLIVRRFIAVFADASLREMLRISIDVNGHRFYIRGSQVLEKGWRRFYEPYVTSGESIIPKLAKGQALNIKEIIVEEKFSKPPPRYNPSSLLKKMEETEIGTKTTRADIVQTLYDREYVKNEQIIVTGLGFGVIDVLEKYSPQVVSPKLSIELEERMSRIRKGNEERERVLCDAVETLRVVTKRIRENEKRIGEQLAQAIREVTAEKGTVGACPNCKTGKLVTVYSKRTGKRFIGCTNYYKGQCRTSFPIPQKGIIRKLGRNCPKCGFPIVQVRKRARRSWNLCFNPRCPSRKIRVERAFEVQNMR